MMSNVFKVVLLWAFWIGSAFAGDAFWQTQPIIKNPDGTFIIAHNTERGTLPYHVCPREVDLINAYDIAEIAAYWDALPDGDDRKQIYKPSPVVPFTLEETKASKKAEIDTVTNRIRDRDGLSFSGERFAMNDGAMLKWTGLMAAKDILPYPMIILTIDDKPFTLANQAALMQFLVAVLGYETAADSPLTTGRALRQRVEAAQTVEEVNAIIDDRD